MNRLHAARFAGLLWYFLALAAHAASPCRIEVVESGSGWPVPLVQLRTVNEQVFVTDNAGLIAIDDPELMGRDVFFYVEGHGYAAPTDGFGFSGVRLTLEPGATRRVELERTIIARRLGRLTGAGQFAHAQRLGEQLDLRESGVVGCDSIQSVVHRGRHYWFWGDTSLPHYPLGIFHMSGATTDLATRPSSEPPLRMQYEYFRDEDGRPRGVARMPGDGPTWLTGLVSLPDDQCQRRLVASYLKIRPPLEAYRLGLCIWDDAAERFMPWKDVWTQSEDAPRPPPAPSGHPVRWTDEAGVEWVLFGDPLPTLRCRAALKAYQDPGQWETMESQATIPAAGDGRGVEPHRGSICWNAWRERWVTVFTERFGEPSAFGELWYAEADSPAGPWGPAVKILSHNNYTFYNPRIHPEFSSGDSPVLLFEGTYTQQFADHARPTPRYDYNQILYRLDLDDERLAAAR